MQLKKWSFIRIEDNPYMAPEIRPFYLAGIDEEGRSLRTSMVSKIVKADSGLTNEAKVFTMNSKYLIKKDDVDPEYFKILKDEVDNLFEKLNRGVSLG